MTSIGTFTRDGNGYAGTITTLTLKAKTVFKPIEKSSEKTPDFRVYAAGVEVGAAWSMTSKANKPYLSVKLDDPSFAAAITCRMVAGEGGDTHQLVWSR
jgi:uncharacterized protein (DUF736 family)